MPGQAFKKGERVHHAAAGGDGNVLASDLHGQRLGLQARAVAGLAGLRGLVLAKLLPHPGAVGLQHAAVEIADDAFERLVDFVALLAVLEPESDGDAAGAVEDDVLDLLGQFRPRSFEREAIFAGRSEEQTSELQSLMRNSYAVFCLKK